MGNRKMQKRFGQVILITVLSIFTLLCVLPVILVIIASFSTDASIAAKGFSFLPDELTVDAWKYLGTFKSSLMTGYKMTLFETIIGVLVRLLITSMFAYAISRRTWRARGFLSLILLSCMLFNGGMVATYIVYTTMYHLKDNLLVLILPGAMNVMDCIIMRTFITSNVPDDLIDAAKIDGASEGYLYFRVVMPLMKPCLASLGFMAAVAHWNQWQTSYLYIDDPNKTTLQLMLIRIEKNLDFLRNNMATLSSEELQLLAEMPSDAVRMAILLVTLGPMLVIYPFFQKHFTKGMTIGAVKG